MAGPGSTFSALNDALALQYDREFRGVIEWSKGTLGAMIKKVVATGLTTAIPVRSGVSAAVSATFANAQTQAQTVFTKVEQFLPPITKKYGVAQIDGLLLRAAKQEKGRVFDNMCQQIDGINDGVMQSFSWGVYGNGYGAIGKVGTAAQGETLASTRLVLANPEDVVKFVPKMKLMTAQDDVSACRNGGATVTVLGIEDLQKGWVTLTGNLTAGIAAATFGDSLYVEGDRAVGATPTPLCLNGLDGWFPTTAPTTTDWATGVDRSNDANLRGTIIDLSTSTKNKEEAVIEAVTASVRYGGDANKLTYFTNNTNYKELTLLGMSKFRPTTVKGPYGIGFQGVKVFTDSGEIPVMPDRFCPVQRSYLLDMGTIKYYGVGSAEVPMFIDDDGAGKILRMTDADAVECRVGYFGYIGCNNPVVNVVVVHSTT
ncbi:MAG TPA: hypothetical protein VFI42_12945 [Thermomicrobiaceae bacterium]|nr:hypothetical protein [Thermomicrobiaceae bacterium]